MPPARRRAPRSLADDLRGRSDDDLAALLRARPDLAHPAPTDTTSLAARASTRTSVQRALDRLDTPTLQALTVLAALPSPATRGDVSAAAGTPVGPYLARARTLALVWGGDRALRLVRGVADVLGPYPAGLGPALADLALPLPPARVAGWCEDHGLPVAGDPVTDAATVAAHLADPAVVTRLLDDAPARARDLLDRLTWHGPHGTIGDADRTVRAAPGLGPVDWLLAHALLVPHGPGRVTVPREVGIALRGGVVLRGLDTAPPAAADPTTHPTARVDGTAAAAAADATRLVQELADLWGRAPAPVLRSGGVGVRELRRAATALDVDDPTAARAAEIAYAAGLLAQDGRPDPAWAPTPAYDLWRTGDPAHRWAALARAWARSSRAAVLAGTRDHRDAARNALSDALERPSVVHLRHDALTALADLPHGTAPTTGDLAARLRWARPRGPLGPATPTSPGAGSTADAAAAGNAAGPDSTVRTGAPLGELLLDGVLADAAWLGVTGLGALSTPGRALLTDDDPADVLAALLPAPVEHVLLQADLTAVAPGPLVPEVAHELALLADVDSRGGATVYRFDAGTVRRALDAGRTAGDVLDFLAAHSRTPVPQPLEYLVGDVARRHGQLRVGTARAYLRCDDESTLSELLADRRTAVLRLRRLAPTVLACQADPTTVLETLRELGHTPAAEGPDGAVVLHRPDEHRTPPREPPRPVGGLPDVDDRLAAAVIAGLRHGDETRPADDRAADGPTVPRLEPSVSLAELRDAAADRRRVWVGLSDTGGRVARRLVEPLGVDAGRITVFDHGTGEVRTLLIHRVTGVAPVDEASDPDTAKR